MAKTITIDGKQHKLKDLSDQVKNSLKFMQFMDERIQSLQMEIAATKTARSVYGSSLGDDLPENETTDENNVLNYNGKKYAFNDLSAKAKNTAASIRMCDQELNALETKLAIAQTARNGYAKSVRDELGKTKY